MEQLAVPLKSVAREQAAGEPVLDVQDLQTYFYTRTGLVKAVDGVSFSLKRGETLAIVGEFGLRQERDGALAHAPRRRPARPHRRRLGAPRRRRPRRARCRGDALHPRQGDLHDLPGADDLAQPGDDHRPPDRRGAAAARDHLAQSRAGAHHRDAAAGRHPGAQAAGQGIPAPALGRHAPARHDRHGARLQSEGADRRRADFGPRRHHPGSRSSISSPSCAASSAPPSSSSPTISASWPRPPSG